ncbi:MAG: anthranilate synthase component I, partial [Anaerolineae bacterium]|nr:anthranilate synthase component I [Anaerolineae bacterium]
MAFSPVIARAQADATPTRAEVHRLFEKGDLVPVYRTLVADLETPVSVYLKLAEISPVSFLLESVEGGEQISRYSFLGVNPRGSITVKGRQMTRVINGESVTRELMPGQDPLHAIKQEFARYKPLHLPGLPRFVG